MTESKRKRTNAQHRRRQKKLASFDNVNSMSDWSLAHAFVALVIYIKVLILLYFGIKFLLSSQEPIRGTHPSRSRAKVRPD